MTDKELVETAAKAYGISISGWVKDKTGIDVGWYADDQENTRFFQPLLKNSLTDFMGDALRLLNKLKLSIEHDALIETNAFEYNGHIEGEYEPGVEVWIIAVNKNHIAVDIKTTEFYKDNVDAATCRAIVRLAAEYSKYI